MYSPPPSTTPSPSFVTSPHAPKTPLKLPNNYAAAAAQTSSFMPSAARPPTSKNQVVPRHYKSSPKPCSSAISPPPRTNAPLTATHHPIPCRQQLQLQHSAMAQILNPPTHFTCHPTPSSHLQTARSRSLHSSQQTAQSPKMGRRHPHASRPYYSPMCLRASSFTPHQPRPTYRRRSLHPHSFGSYATSTPSHLP